MEDLEKLAEWLTGKAPNWDFLFDCEERLRQEIELCLEFLEASDPNILLELEELLHGNKPILTYQGPCGQYNYSLDHG